MWSFCVTSDSWEKGRHKEAACAGAAALKHIRFMHVQLKTEQGGIVKNYYLSLKALGRCLRQKEQLDLVSGNGFCVLI